ncbi:response regulator [Sporomusa malonica]|uniref:Response regulator receiver domain-containing protein n=1 Tax=Sporomusa malonica TaxID=112901 RepID=A0A1W1ZNW9_9FIRM|nr:response regulator [Sporomusa malonica]SMC50074.1 Response regulator receiver domain-containing protein [Sporomusa malonica]
MNNETDKLIFGADNDDSLLVFSPEHEAGGSNTWKVMIVDDDRSIHQVTKHILKDFTFEGKPLRFFSAYSPDEAIELVRRNPDVAVMLLDVVMDGDKAGLKVARFIREVLNNRLVRIILRTGQPQEAPEETVIRDYDINDYKEKTELTARKLTTTMIASLRSYRDIVSLDNNKKGLEKTLESAAALLEAQSLKRLASCILTQLLSILSINPHHNAETISGLVAVKEANGEFYILDGTEKYCGMVGCPARQMAAGDLEEIIDKARQSKKGIHFDHCFIQYFHGKNQHETFIYLEGLNSLTDWEKNLINIFGMTVAATFDNSFLAQEIEDTQKEIIFTLGEFSEARSKETGNHVRRVAEYSKLLALKYGLPEDEAELIKLASPMHDVGKLGITDTILNKPGKLAPEEFEVIKAHGVLGYEILRSSNRKIMKAAAIIALQHHEKYDGTGYPDGLKGEDIHIYGRITAIADVFDALGSNRVYKAAWPLDKILEYFASEKGIHFDPKLVDIFMENLEEFLHIRDTFKDM